MSKVHEHHMRALFVDFDGVLHRAGNGLEDVGPPFVWLPLLASALAEHPDVVIVVHSTWRYQHTLSELRAMLSSLAEVAIYAAPRGQRFEAIRWFLKMNPAVQDYRILDDDLSEFDPPPEELLFCDSSMGLTTPGVLDLLEAWLQNTKGGRSAACASHPSLDGTF